MSAASSSAAQFVDQLALVRVGAGPDPAPGQLVHPLRGQPAAGRDLAGEVGVDVVEPGIDDLPLVGAERPAWWRTSRHACRAPPSRCVTPALPSISLTTGLPLNDADRAGHRSWLGDDRVGGHRDEVTARGRDIAHRHDDRLAGVACPDDLSPDRVGGDIRAARAVHPQHDGPDCGSAVAPRNAR